MSFRSLSGTRRCASTALLAPLLALAVAACSDSDAAPRPDIVLYLCDTLRADHLGTYGYKRDTSPNIDRLAEDSIVFERALAPSSWTKASTASFLTGLDPTQHNANGRDTRLADRVQMLSETLKEAGYYNVGLVTNPFVSKLFGFEQGYDSFKFLGRALAEKLMDEVGAAIDNRPSDKPLFLYVHSIDPHAPYDPPAPHKRDFSDSPGVGNPDELNAQSKRSELKVIVDSYDSEIRYHDEQFKRLIAKLKSEGIYEDCMFWFVSDHGDEFLEHGRGGHGRQLFDESLHIPMILKLPGNEHAGTRIAARASLIDAVPTLLSYLNIFPPAESEGIDLLANLEKRAQRPPLYLDLDLMVEELFVVNGVIRGKYKYMEEKLPTPRKFLFNLEEDPKEIHNLIESEPELARELAMLVKIHDQGKRTGLALRLVGKGTQSAKIVLRSEGLFTGAEMLETEKGDGFSIAAGGHVLTIECELKEYRSNIGELPTSDIDTIILQLDPPHSEVSVESLELVDSEESFPLYLGLKRIQSSVPHVLDPGDPILETEDLGLLFQAERRAAGSNVRGDAKRVKQPKPGLYAVALEPFQGEDVDSLPEDIRRQLEELGYLGSDEDDQE